jgi:hypothetical protein
MSTPATTTAPTSTASTSQLSEPLPSPNTLLLASKIAIEQDRAILLDYYRQTANGTAFLGEDEHNKEHRVLVKSKEEFTSLIKKLYKAGDDCIILTENSIYIISAKIQKRKVNLAKLQEAYDSEL